MRQKYLIANWKMNKSKRELVAYFTALEKSLGSLDHSSEFLSIAFALPFPLLDAAQVLFAGKNFHLAAQNMHWEDRGAYTGEVSALMLKELGVSAVLIGHSERRTYFKEDHQSLSYKVKQCLKHQMQPVFCVGETAEERASGATFEVIGQQISQGLAAIKEVGSLVLAYEPVWAIGTGSSASGQDAQRVHAFIRRELGRIFGGDEAEKVRILYGGSVQPLNAVEFLAEQDIDGALVGGASLDAEVFSNLILSLRGIM
ncbi:MAG: triose-phosphate isomerase [Oligoflexales bacterium]|nr:triose-phosphate isomerase [Oligoflexales bacterium]